MPRSRPSLFVTDNLRDQPNDAQLRNPANYQQPWLTINNRGEPSTTVAKPPTTVPKPSTTGG
jgi:hypothetical protein